MKTSKCQGRLLPLVALVFLFASGAQAERIPGTTNSLPRLVTRHGTFKLGKIPYPAGTRKKWIAEGRVLGQAPKDYFPRKKTLKGAADNRQYLPPIGSQGSEGSCVHWAGSYYVKTASMKRRDPSINVSVSSNQCSPRFTYNLCNAGQDNGSYGHEPFELFMRYGVPSLRQLPYVAGQYATLPAVADFVEGLHRRSTNYVWVWEWNPGPAQINELKAYLDEGGVAACGVDADDTFDAWSSGDAPWVGPVCTAADINHMVTVCGYGPGYYLVANSWGASFGSNGFIRVDSGYFENYVSDVMYPLEGAYEPAVHQARIQIQHGRRSDIRSLAFSVNGATVWSNSPLPRNAPLGAGSFDTDFRAGWQLAVDLSAAPWSETNFVTAWCMDLVSGTTGFLTNFMVVYDGQSHVAADTPVSISDNNPEGALATVSIQGATTLSLNPANTNVPAAASSGRQIAVTASVSWTATTNQPWLWITSGFSGATNGTVTYSLQNHTGLSARTGTIMVAGGGLTRTCTVVQAAAPDSCTLSEAVDALQWTWTTGGNANWVCQNPVTWDGVDAVQSGAIAPDQQSWIQATVTGPGTLSFWWKVSSPASGDFLSFQIGNAVQESISGNMDWQPRSFGVPSGNHTLRWSYTKDSADPDPMGSDCGWVDQAVWVPGSIIWPSGGQVVTDRRPPFAWLAVSGATWYEIWINRNGQNYLNRWVQDVTTWRPPEDLCGGDYSWWVRPWGPAIGFGAWSEPALFTIPAGTPGALTQLAPQGEQDNSNLTYRWNKDANATWYRLWVGRTGMGTWHDRWYELSGVGEGAVNPGGAYPGPAKPIQTAPAGMVGQSPPVFRWSGGACEWWLRGWGPDGYGPWSGSMAFSIPHPADAWYRLYVSRGSTKVVDQWIQDASLSLSSTLLPGSYSWWVGVWDSQPGQTIWSGRMDFSVQ